MAGARLIFCQWLWEEFRVTVARQTSCRELRAGGYRSPRRGRRHVQAAGPPRGRPVRRPNTFARIIEIRSVGMLCDLRHRFLGIYGAVSHKPLTVSPIRRHRSV